MGKHKYKIGDYVRITLPYNHCFNCIGIINKIYNNKYSIEYAVDYITRDNKRSQGLFYGKRLELYYPILKKFLKEKKK